MTDATHRQKLGWTPYAWLVYLGIFLSAPFLGDSSPALRIATVAGAAVFVPIYLSGFRGPAHRVPWVIGAILLLGLGFAPFNWGAGVFFVYGAGFLGYGVPWNRSLAALGGIALLPLLEAWILGLHPAFWIPATVFSLLIGGVNIHFGRVARLNAALRRSDEEIRRLARLAERERIARDLHDLLGHTLTVVLRKAELARRLAERDPPAAAREMADVEEVARRALREVQAAVTGYRRTDLATELARARSELSGAGIEVRLESSPVELPGDAEQALALALREGVTNVLRHSGARDCLIRLQAGDGETRLEIADDGRGGTVIDGSGLTGMRERIGALGGRVEREGGRGTRLTVTLPFGRPAPGEAVT